MSLCCRRLQEALPEWLRVAEPEPGKEALIQEGGFKDT